MHKILGVLQDFFFLRNKMRKERMRERKEGGINFQENVLALEVGRWAAEDET